jgi:hypothetical protein
MDNECKMKCNDMELSYYGECKDDKAHDNKDYGKDSMVTLMLSHCFDS